MPLSLPNLDTRRWTDLVEEGLALIPRHAPEWTDHNASDPGVTVVELLAFLIEQDLYWLNRVPERHRRKFLALVGTVPRLPQPAQTVLALALAAGVPARSVPSGTVWEVPGRGVPFATTAPVTALPAALVALVADGVDRSAAPAEGRPLPVFGPAPVPGATLALGFDAPLAAAQELSLWFAVTRARPRPEASEPGPGPVAHHSVRTQWEAWGDDGSGDGPAWLPVPAVDATSAFTVDGFVRLTLPAPTVPTEAAGRAGLHVVRCRYASGTYDAVPEVRVVVANAVPAEQAVPVFRTYAVAAGGSAAGPFGIGESGRLSGPDVTGPGSPEVAATDLVLPTPALDGRVTLDLVLLGRADGRPTEEFDLPAAPVAAGRVEVWTVDPDGAWATWAVGADFDAAGPADRTVIVDMQTGRVRFGDGDHGAVPVAGAAVFARYRSTSGGAGNVAAGASWALADHAANRVLGIDPVGLTTAVAEVVNPVPASAGADAESVGAAAGRAAATLWASERLVELADAARASSLDQVPDVVRRVPTPPGRATTLLDIERMALAVPGVRVARCRARSGLDHRFPCLQAPGTVTLVVVPELPARRPMPSPELVAAVRAHLHPRRVVGTRLLVTGPRYVEVSVRAVVVAKADAAAGRVARDVAGAVDRFLDPLVGGDAGMGRPFGRDVHRSEVLGAIDDVVGVDHVVDLELRADDGEAQCGHVCLGPADLATPGTHDIVVEPAR